MITKATPLQAAAPSLSLFIPLNELAIAGVRVRNPKYAKRLSGGVALVFGFLFGTRART